MASFNSKNYSSGDKVRVETTSDAYEGTFLPSEDESIITIKLDSGYNVGVKINNIKRADLVEKAKEKKATAKQFIKQDKSLPKITILHTGGTIASKIDYRTGGVTADFSPEELLSLFPELLEIAQIDSLLVKQMMSENLRFDHYNLLAKAVEAEVKKGVDGIIITHGTDTLHYSAAALAFSLANIPVPVIIVGAQRSSDRGSSDAAFNLIAAAKFIAHTDFSEVAVCMHQSMNDDACYILPATKVRKMHTSRRDAFRSINARPFAKVDPKSGKIEFINKAYVKRGDKKDLEVKFFKPKLKVGLLKSHTHMYAEEFLAFQNFDGLVIEGTALGQLPNAKVDEFTAESDKIGSAIRTLTSKMPVVMASQCVYGLVDMNVYSEGRRNIDLGVLGNYSNMTPETTFIKLAWLLSNFDKEAIPELITTNFRGEMADRIEDDMFLN